MLKHQVELPDHVFASMTSIDRVRGDALVQRLVGDAWECEVEEMMRGGRKCELEALNSAGLGALGNELEGWVLRAV